MTRKMTSLTNINVKLGNKTNMKSHNDSNRWPYQQCSHCGWATVQFWRN